MSAQDRTLEQYHHWMTLNATSHLIRAGRQTGIFAQLRERQHTLEQLCERLNLRRMPTKLLLDALVAIGIVEQYREDYALSRAAHLLCQYDDDLGDQRWQQLVDVVQGRRQQIDDHLHQRHTAATQWVHTPAAIQAAEILDIGGENQASGLKILDLGCGSAVWSCAMAHRDPRATVTAVDYGDALVAARQTADSIGLGDRFRTIEGGPELAELAEADFDLVLIAQRLSGLGDQEAELLLQRAVAAAGRGGRIVIIDLVHGPADPTLVEAVEALRIDLATQSGRIRNLLEMQEMLAASGARDIQFTFLTASRVNLGLAVGAK